MIKVSECQLCGNYFRTGKIRQILEKGLVFDADGGKSKFRESKLLVCKSCYGHILKGDGVARVGGNASLFNDFPDGSHGEFDKYGEELEKKLESSKLKTPERKKRGRKPKSELGIATDKVVVEEAKSEVQKVEIVPKTNYDRLKEAIRERYNAQGTVIYADLASELNADEFLIVQICDELDKEKEV